MTRIFATFILLLSTLTSCAAHKEAWDDNKEDWSELMLAIYKGKTDKFIKLIEQGADVNFVTPGTHSNWKLTALDVAIRKDNEVAAKTLLATNKINHPEKYFMTACGQEKALTVDLLIQHGANVNDTLENGYSMLIYAASFGSYDVLACLLKHGANVKQTRKIDGMTPLMFAAFNGQPKKVKLLLNNGADKKVKDKNGKTALEYIDDIYEHLNVSQRTKTELRELLK